MKNDDASKRSKEMNTFTAIITAAVVFAVVIGICGFIMITVARYEPDKMIFVGAFLIVTIMGIGTTALLKIVQHNKKWH